MRTIYFRIIIGALFLSGVACSPNASTNILATESSQYYAVCEVGKNSSDLDGQFIRIKGRITGYHELVLSRDLCPGRDNLSWRGGSSGRIATYSGSVITRGSTVASGLLAANDVRSAYSAEGRFGANTQVATGRGVGGLAGSAAGGKAGAGVGAAIGLMFAGAGALPGAIIGGVLGAVGGGIAGSHVGGETVRGIHDRGASPSRCR